MLCKSTLDPRTADRAVQVLLEDLADFGRMFRIALRYSVCADGFSICPGDCSGRFVGHPLANRS